ncbi:arad-like aldolase/epimerase [Cucurbitaria berberidis CBS 394.84]|uniref:Arad-like aldolase/epimerase n=1 Tax=Cucurbitaria berberidis CBS 394.84 TaxID=1168544 RepID=A0A9P4GMQ8_9PLEO|nr:arad-like aldolase/epimerase [Cucurbitaria berberidis CBS 394.84]KAF1849268.1 arad-like aldolase/epimerase [Cucurbitaria berberidis CBS 394.84]
MSAAYFLPRSLSRAFTATQRRPCLRKGFNRALATSSKPLQASVAAGVRVDHAESNDNRTVAAMGRTTSGKALKVRKYPSFTSLEDERLYRKQHLAAAYRVFASRGFDEGVAGHISVRDPILTDHFWLNPLSTHFSLIRVSDLILVNEAGEVVEGDQPINAAAFAIHSAIHKRRSNVHAACHAHSVHGKAFSAFGRELDMITQDSIRFYKSHGVYKQFGGVVLASEEGERIADALGDGKAAILQNHGILTVGQSVDEAAFWFLSLDKTCQAQLLVDAASAGSGHKPKIIPDVEAAETYNQVGTPEKGWLAFQSYYDEVLAKTGGDFLR